MNRTEWLKGRQSYIGGSDVAAILGLSRWKTAFDVWLSKTGEIDEPEEEPKHFVRGRFLERAISDWYADKFNVKLAHTDPFHTYPGPEPWMSASVDATVLPGEGVEEEYGLECKSARSDELWGKSGTDKTPVDVQIQCYWYMACTGMKRWDVAALFTLSDDFRHYTLHQDPEVERNIVDRCRAWWQHHVVEGHKPSIDGSEGASDYLKKKFPSPRKPLRAAMTAEISQAVEYKRIGAQIRDLERARKSIKNQLAESIGSAEGFYWGGGKATYRLVETKSYTVRPKSYRKLDVKIKGD